MNAYTLSFASMILVAAALGDRFGRRTVFLIGIAIFGVGSVLAALSTDPAQLIGARALQGFGAAGVLLGRSPSSGRGRSRAATARDRHLGRDLGSRRRGRAARRRCGDGGWSWQAIFWINVPVALIAIPLAYFALNNDFGQRARIDVVGALLAGAAVLGLVHAIVAVTTTAGARRA